MTDNINKILVICTTGYKRGKEADMRVTVDKATNMKIGVCPICGDNIKVSNDWYNLSHIECLMNSMTHRASFDSVQI